MKSTTSHSSNIKDYLPLNHANILDLFKFYLGNANNEVPFQNQEANILSLLQSAEFTGLPRYKQLDLLNQVSGNGVPLINNELILKKADNILAYLVKEKLINFQNLHNSDIFLSRLHGKHPTIDHQKNFVNHFFQLYRSSYPDLIMIICFDPFIFINQQLTLIIGKSDKLSLFYQTVYSISPKLKGSDNLVNEILKFSEEQIRIIYIAHLLDIELQKHFLINDKSEEVLSKREIQDHNHSLIILMCITNGLMNLNKELIDIAKESMSSSEEYIELADYSKLYNNFIETIKAELAKTNASKNNNKDLIFKSLACENLGDAESLIYYFISGQDINIRDSSNRSLLIKAVKENYYLVYFLIIHGIDLNLRDINGDTALNLAVANNDPSKVESLLLNGADPNISNKLKRTPLITALKFLYSNRDSLAEMVKIFIAFDTTDINKAGENGETPLYIAAEMGSTEAVRILLVAGADQNIRNNKGVTALERIQSLSGHVEIEELFKRATFLSILPAIQANISLTTQDRTETVEKSSIEEFCRGMSEITSHLDRLPASTNLNTSLVNNTTINAEIANAEELIRKYLDPKSFSIKENNQNTGETNYKKSNSK